MTDEENKEEPMAAEAALDITETSDLFESVQADLARPDPIVPEETKEDKEEEEDVYDTNWSTGDKRAWFERHPRK